MQSITRSLWLGLAAGLALLFVATSVDAYPVGPAGSGLTALSTTPQGVQRTPTNAGPVGTGMTVGGMGNRLTPPTSLPIQTQLGGTNSINATQRLFGNTPYGGAVQGSTMFSPMPAYNGTGFSTGRLRTNTSAFRAIPGPQMTAPPYSLGNPAYPNGQTPGNTANPPGTTNGTINNNTGTTYNNTGRAQYGQDTNGTRNPATGNETTFGNNSALQYSRTPNGTANGAANTPAQPNAPAQSKAKPPQAQQGPIQYGWW
jgi:hypothetical protein